jgi:hypothetical protein
VNDRRLGRFHGVRTNCEFVPCLPARVVAAYIADPREVPYLLVWNDRQSPIERMASEMPAWRPMQAARLGSSRFLPVETGDSHWVELRQLDGQCADLQFVHRPMPRGAGSALLLVCSWCGTPKRAVYGRAAFVPNAGHWVCRICAGLRYASEGSALIFRSRWAVAKSLSGLRLFPRPAVWNPIVFTSPLRALELGVVRSAADNSRHSKV